MSVSSVLVIWVELILAAISKQVSKLINGGVRSGRALKLKSWIYCHM